MTAGQRKKRVNAASLVGCASYERYKVKKKKVETLEPDLGMIPNPVISLEWDSKKKIVVSKRDQIGISQRHLIPFAEHASRRHDILGDVVSVPREIFELDNLSEVLSYEVWQSVLTKNERRRLTQFLPKEVELDTLVQDLLSGDNFHFGNPLLTWSGSLCFGELHPDNVLHEEQSLKACKNVYHSFLQKYHNDVIGTLQLWKEKWDNCEDPEVDIAQIIWRSRNFAEKSMTPEWYDSEGNHDATPDSCTNSEKAPSGDNQDSRIASEDFERRKDYLNRGVHSFSGKNVAAAPRQVEKLHKYNIQHGDGTRYMSYVKVSKQQHERVKCSMKQAGDNMHPRSLNNVLGNIDSLNVQPFERFEEEEKKKLKDYWLKLANQDIFEGFAYRSKRQLLRQQLIQSLGEEARQKFEHGSTSDEEKNGSHCSLTEHSNDNKEENMPTITHEGTEQSGDSFLGQSDNEDTTYNIETELEDEKHLKNLVLFREQALDVDKIERVDFPDHNFIQDHHQQSVTLRDRMSRGSNMVMENSNPIVLQDRHLQRMSTVDVNPPIRAVEIESLVTTTSVETDDSSVMPLYARNLNQVISPASQEGSLTSVNKVWPAGDVHSSYYHSVAASTEYASSQELTLGHSRFIQEQPLHMLDLTTNRRDKDAVKDMFVSQSEHASFSSSYANHDRNELLQSVFKGQNGFPYHHEPKHLSLDFQPAINPMMQTGQYHGQLTPSTHLDLNHKRMNDLYMQQTLQESIYSDGGRYTMPRQGNLAVNPPETSVRLAVSSQAHMNCGELNQNWYAGGNGHQDMWPAFENAAGVNHSLGVRNSDQSLFSVLSECNKLRPGAGYVGSSERFIHAGNYSEIGEGAHSSSIPLQATNSFNYMNGYEDGGNVKINNIGWVGIPKQNSGSGKPFAKSWQ